MKAPVKPKILAPAGTHVARLVQIVYLGTESSRFGDNFKVNLSWELPTETHTFKEGEAPKPFMVSQLYTLSMGLKSHLRPVIEGMLGQQLKDDEAYALDLDTMLGKECLLSVVHETKETGTYTKIKSASKLPKGMTCPAPVNLERILSFDKWDEEFYQSLPNFLKEKISKSPEYAKMKSGKKVDDDDPVNPDDIPF